MHKDYILELLLFLTIYIVLCSSNSRQHSIPKESGSGIRCIERERQALLNFKEQLVDESDRLSSWGDEERKKDCCRWKGVHCHNRTNRVTGLDLGGHSTTRLRGKISPALLELQNLNFLDLSLNDFGIAPIPQFIGSFSELEYLNLSFSRFHGQVPQQLGNLSKLRFLDLNSDGDGCFSENLSWFSRLSSLEYLDLRYVNLSRATNWLESVRELPCLKELHLSKCDLPNVLPSWLPSSPNVSAPLSVLDLSMNSFGSVGSLSNVLTLFSNYSSSLTQLYLGSNKFSGPIPDIFAQYVISLSVLDLSNNLLEGGVPKYFGMGNLTYLNLQNNSLTAQLPDVFMSLSGPLENKLQHLDLGFNLINGSFPNISRFSSLTNLMLSHNQLSGTINEGYLQLPNLVGLDLSSNQLVGAIPDLSFSPSLTYLVLSRNKFNGSLKESIGRLYKLETLWISSNLLEGVITESHLFNLSNLRYLHLSSNSFLTINLNPHWIPPFQLRYVGMRHCKLGPQFPVWLKTQRHLEFIDISNAGISDAIPNWFGNWDFFYLNASSNQLYGVCPNFSFPYLDHVPKLLDLSRNHISGAAMFVCSTTAWLMLDLSDNLLFGQFPDCYTSFELLEYLNLANNRFSGKIPNALGSLIRLEILSLRNNSFSGEMPNSMRNCHSLKMIDFGENRLSGSIPPWIDNFTQLEVLVLRSNGFSGSIPSNLCGLINLSVLDLSFNKLFGGIPKCVGNYTSMTVKTASVHSLYYESKAYYFVVSGSRLKLDAASLGSAYIRWKGVEMTYTKNLGLVKLIDLSSNNLFGEIPREITRLHCLLVLNFSNNHLTGSIPIDIGQLKSLDVLDLSRNSLSGTIPISLSELSLLGILNLSYNNLFGRIPVDGHLSTFDESTYVGNPRLCGRPLNKLCQGDGNVMNTPSHYNQKEEVDELISKGFYISMGIGFVVGYWGSIGILLRNKSFKYCFSSC